MLDASPVEISALIYQEDEQGRCVLVDEVSRALSAHEKNWDSQIEWESLGKMWGMMMFCHYLIGVNFTAWRDQQPLLLFYNDMSKAVLVRINKHRNKILNLKFLDEYLLGKEMPCDYTCDFLFASLQAMAFFRFVFFYQRHACIKQSVGWR